ncbi:MAG: single-stranded DNA-binding protein [Candidatus Sungbacteria bacterium]|uniref:Single-stranded DNA-binding protein n=1 Tax=Candidatus Sungiibacteriota bacterium TaxID=2750080 RepID=A0A932VQY9_9BACT|nr:single-stranded DNA-binding protein [Candidatus Sungbacteria bacterium]
MNLNKAFILGNLTRDPELRQTPTGQSVCSFGVATNRFYTDGAGTRQKQAEFHNVVAWGRNAEIIKQYLHKGNSILVEGHLQTRSWQDTQGTKHWRTEVIAERIQLGPRPAGPGSGEGGLRQSAGSDEDAPPTGGGTSPGPLPTIELSQDGEEIDIKDIPF